MKNTKLFAVLNALPARELGYLKLFVADPLFNSRPDLRIALDFLADHGNYPFAKKALFAKVYPGLDFKEKEMNLLSSRLLKLVEDYIALWDMLDDPVSKKIHLAKAYRKLRLEQHFKTAVRDAQSVLGKHPLQNAFALRQRFDLEDEYYDYIASPNRIERTNLQAASDTFDAYFLATKLKQACLHLSRHTINQEQYNIGFLEESLHYLEARPHLLELPAVAVYFYCYKAITTADESYFARLRQSIANHQQSFRPGEIRDIYFLAINYCIRRLNGGEQPFILEALALYKDSLEQGFLLEGGAIPESTFSNIVSLALKLGEFDWTKRFIHGNSQYLKDAFRNSILHFSLAKLFFEQGMYKESMKEAVLVDTKAPFLMLGTKTLQLKIYYELGAFDALDSLLESLRLYIQRSKNLGYRKKNYEYLLTFTRKLIELVPGRTAERESLLQAIQQTEPFTEKEWFVRQIESLK